MTGNPNYINEYKITPPGPPNDGLLFVDHQSKNRSGHNGHSLNEYKKDHVLAFYLNASADEISGYGHHPHGWTEYRRSVDGGKSWGEAAVLDYSKEVFDDPQYFSAYIMETVLAPDNNIIAIGCRFLKNYPEFDKAFYMISADGGESWSEARDFCPPDPVYGRPESCFVDNGEIFVLWTDGAKWGEKSPHRLYVSQDNGKSFSRRSDLTLDIECWYGTMRLLDNGNIIAYGYRNKDEHNLQYVISDDKGNSWSEPATTYMAKKIRNPQLSDKLGRLYFMHGRSGHHGDDSHNLVLYSSEDGLSWDDGIFLYKGPGKYAYSANAVIGEGHPENKTRLLIQSSIPYDGKRRVNVHHWWVEVC